MVSVDQKIESAAFDITADMIRMCDKQYILYIDMYSDQRFVLIDLLTLSEAVVPVARNTPCFPH